MTAEGKECCLRSSSFETVSSTTATTREAFRSLADDYSAKKPSRFSLTGKFSLIHKDKEFIGISRYSSPVRRDVFCPSCPDGAGSGSFGSSGRPINPWSALAARPWEVRHPRSEAWVYRAVIRGVECPSCFATSMSDAPLSIAIDPKL